MKLRPRKNFCKTVTTTTSEKETYFNCFWTTLFRNNPKVDDGFDIFDTLQFQIGSKGNTPSKQTERKSLKDGGRMKKYKNKPEQSKPKL